MLIQKRFGRKMRLPSTVEIRRDLAAMTKVDALVDVLEKQGGTSEELAAVVASMIDEHEISPDRAQMLINRFGRRKAALATPAGDPDMRKQGHGIG
jgi:hypothetical protein